MIDDTVWGAGYGARRHLFDPEQRKQAQQTTGLLNREYTRPLCDKTAHLEEFSDEPEKTSAWDARLTAAQRVMSLPSCGRCTKKAEKLAGAAK